MDTTSHSEKRGRRAATSGKTDQPPANNAKSLVLSLAKGFRILEAFDSRDPELTMSEIARRADLDTGTTFRLIKTLVMLGYLSDAGSKRYRLGFKIVDLGFTALARMDLHTLARPLLLGLVGPLVEAASIGILDGPDVIYIERVQAGMSQLGVTRGIGSRVPAYCSAVGHAILANMPVEQRLQVLNMRERVKHTPHTPVTIAELETRMEAVRKQGYAFSDQELVLGVRSLAAPILDRGGHPLATLSAGAPSFACARNEFVEHTAIPVMKAEQSLSRALSISGSTALGR